MQMYFYCLTCNHKITMEQIGLLNEGKCPNCSSLEGFSSSPKSQNDKFETLTVINDTELLKGHF